MKRTSLLFAATFLLLLAALPTGAKVRYVKQGATGDGSSWNSAMGSLQDAINQSATGDEVWIAAGTYQPEELIKSSKPLSRAFMLKDGVSLYGGFAGTETAKEDRQLKASGKPYDFRNETILSADDAIPDTWVREFQDATSYRYAWHVENSVIPGTKSNYHHVLYAATELTAATEINGLTLTGAHANDFRSKAAGGALYAKGNIHLHACRIVENSAWFKNESTSNSDTNGGAVYLDGKGEATITDCYFARNYSHSSYGNGCGGAVYAKHTTISHCDFEDCVALDMGGAVYNEGGTTDHCHFINCYAGSGGAIYNAGTAEHNIVYDCRGLLGGGIYNTAAASYNIIADCYADMIEMGDSNGGKGGGLYNKSGDVLGSVVFNNTAFIGGGIYMEGGRVINCTVQNNRLRQEDAHANIGFASNTMTAGVLNTIGNPNADRKNFTHPTQFNGVASTAADTAAIREADWSLADGSEFIDTGSPTEGITEATDISGNPRIAGQAIDKGAYEREAAKVPSMILTYNEAGHEVTVGTGGSTGTKFQIDWGDGTLEEYSKAAYITHTTLGTEVKVYGDNLLVLAATNQELKAVDITHAPALSRIQVGGNMLTKLDVSQNANLTGIYCEKNKIDTLDVKNCKFLRVLDCHDNEITGTIDCSDMVKLSKVDCADNKIESLVLPHHDVLIQVDCSRNQLTALDVAGLTALEDLSCTENRITTLNLSDLAHLTSLYAFSNKLTTLDIAPCARLTTLSASDNDLASIDLQSNKELEGIYLFHNKLTSVDLSKCPNVKWLNVSDNELSELNITLQPQLSLLNANNNHIQTIDLSRNTLLQQIHLSGNRLSSLDVSKLSRLSWLKIDNNDISSLDLTNNSYLYWLECGRNHLAQLDLTHNTYLQRLEANDNSLSTLDLTHNVNLVGILIQRNSLTKDNLNAIIDGLKDVSDVEINENNKTWGRQLNISKMPGTVGADVGKATAKGWIVTAELPDGIGTATATLVPVRKFYFTVDGRLLGYSRPTAAGIYIVREMVGNRVLSAQKEIIK